MGDERAIDELRALANLPENWDSYGAHPVDQRAIQSAADLIRSVRAWATPDGGVSIEWSNDAVSLDFTVGPDGTFFDVTVERRHRPNPNQDKPNGE